MDIRPGITRRYSLIIAATGLLILLLTVSASFMVVWTGAGDVKKSLKENTAIIYAETHHAMLKNLAEYLRHNLFNFLYHLDMERINRMINDMRKGMPVKSFIVTDSSGRALTDGTKENISFGMQLDIDFKAVRLSPVRIEKIADGSRVVFLIGTNDYTAGYGEIIFSEEPLKKALKMQDSAVLQIWDGFKGSFIKIALAVTAILAFITFILGILFSRTLSVPILKLTEATRKIAAGDMSHRVEIETADEIGELAGSFNTMTDRLQKEMELRGEKERLLMNQSKLAAMGEMISAIAHNWRQPLNAMGLIIQGIKDTYEFGGLTKNYIDESVEKSMKQLQFMSRTIDVFRNFFRHGRQKSSFDVKLAIGEVLSILSAQLKGNNISYRLTCRAHNRTSEDFSEIVQCDEMTITGYKTELEQAIFNILNNAADAIVGRMCGRMPDKDGKGLIDIDVSRESNKVVIRISDNGGGIPEKIIGRIFEPYFSTREEGKGTGIGLYMAKVIIEDNMGGRIYAENVENGAMFTIELSLTPSEEGSNCER